MIEVSPDTACILYLAFAVFGVFLVWFATKKKEISRFEMRHKRCEFCHHTYLEDTDQKLSRCPQCQLLNKK